MSEPQCACGGPATKACYIVAACGCRTLMAEPTKKEIRSQWRWFIFFSLLMLTGVSINVYYFLCNIF